MDEQTFWNATGARYDAGTDAFLLFDCAVLTLTLVLGLPGNLWVCWVVFTTKSLQTCNNALLVSLAASDFLKCSVDTPLLLFSLLFYEESQLPVSVCALQQFTYALCSCVQLLTLVSISVDRFQAIAFPFQTDRRKTRVRLWILSIWTCGLILAFVSLTLSPKALFYMLCRPHIRTHSHEHRRYSDPFGPCVLVPVWCLSLTVIVIHYARIFRVVRQHRKKVFNRGVQLRPTVSEHVWGLMKVPASAPRTAPAPRGLLGSLSPAGPVNPLLPRRTALLVAEAGASCAGAATGGATMSPPEIVGSVCLLKPGAGLRRKNQMEGKVAQRFGYIIIAFTLFWVPMVVILLMNVISGQKTDRLLMELETSAVVLTCVQSALDPLIYTLATRQFRSELSKILSSIPGCPLKARA